MEPVKEEFILAAYVLLLKEYEDEEKVIYSFGPNEVNMGKIELNKRTRMFSELEAISDSSIPSKFYFDRAAQKLAICLARGGGVFPDRTTFES